MFLGQRQQFFTWKCNVREALNVKLAMALCNLAVSREEEAPPPNIGLLRVFLQWCRSVPAYQLCRCSVWQIFFHSQPTCNSIWGFIIAYNSQKVAPLNDTYFKSLTGGNLLHLEMHVTLFEQGRAGWGYSRTISNFKCHRQFLGARPVGDTTDAPGKPQQTPDTSFWPRPQVLQVMLPHWHNTCSLSRSSWETPGTAKKRLEVVSLPLQLKELLQEDLDWQCATSPQSQLWTEVQGEAK